MYVPMIISISHLYLGLFNCVSQRKSLTLKFISSAPLSFPFPLRYIVLKAFVEAQEASQASKFLPLS